MKYASIKFKSRPAILFLAGLLTSLPSLSVLAAPQESKIVGQCALKTASGLGFTILNAGTGAAPRDSDTVSVKYAGMLAIDGTTFDQSERADFGVTQVIPGFTEGLKLLKVGGNIRICIPAALGYGAAGAGSIPANADLVFEVALLDIKKAPEPLGLADRQCTTRSASGLGYTILKVGMGEKPTDSDIALINYKGFLAATGAPFDDAGPAPVPVSRVIPGFAEGLKLMQRGGSYKLCIPSVLGYGDKVTGPIPANSTLVFLIELIDFKSLAEVLAMQTEAPQ